MTPSIALGINTFEDSSALRGLLEIGAGYFDNIYVLDASPTGKHSQDGTVELCESFGISPVLADMNDGFGVIRTRLIHDCGCAWCFLADSDERFYPTMPVLNCIGHEFYPAVPNPELQVIRTGDTLTQGDKLKRLIADPHWNAIRTSRRHWFDFTFKRPCQNWLINRDHQLRIVRNIPEIQYRTNVKMHEQLIDTRTGTDPSYAEQDDYGGCYHEHFHMMFRRTNPGFKEAREKWYRNLEEGRPMIP